MNGQLEIKLKQLNEEIAGLRERSVDMKSEEELMREVIVQQNEDLLKRVEELTDESKTADADRRQLLASTAEVLSAVEEGEARVEQRHTDTYRGSREAAAHECRALPAGARCGWR